VTYDSAHSANPPGRLLPSTWLGLEPGALRDELLGEHESAANPPLNAPQHSVTLVFDGRGSEYFRIWVVHTLLTLLTLGVYSAWAKVRKMQWFARHTVLIGDRFDYHANPKRILVGRILAFGLLGLWAMSFEISLVFGMSVLGLLCAAGPVLFVEAQRFKLSNSSWRGIHFGFDVPRKEAYLVCLPPLLLWTSGTVFQAYGASQGQLVVASILPLLALPWAHARLKAMQHHHARFGSQRFLYTPSVTGFYTVYAHALIFIVVSGVFGALVAGVIGELTSRAAGASLLPLLSGFLAAGVIWVLSWPVFAARLQRLVWRQTGLGEVGFLGEMEVGPLLKLVVTQTALVLLTLGLYWPFAAVALARYRVQSVRVVSDKSLADIGFEASSSSTGRSTGDGSADAFGLDLGW
jgi:uncharacterized membrane protein YjgN (DUF898 family)